MKIPHDPNELIAIVDDNDNVIGKYPRKDHADGKLHRETAVLILNKKNEILVQKRTDDGKLDYSASGHFPYNENYIEGAVRELKEELGLKVDKSELVEVFKYRYKRSIGKPNNCFVTVFELKRDYRIEEFNVGHSEVSEVKYYSILELKSLINTQPQLMKEGFVTSLRKYFKIKSF